MKKIFGIVILSVIGLAAFMSMSKKGEPLLTIGDSIPLFELPQEDSQIFNIENVIGKKNLVIYFYPMDDTPGCTKEACKFRDDFEDFTDLDAMVIGISSDSPESHAQFAAKNNLPFTLLSDEDSAVRSLFGVQGNFMGLIPGRVTFIVDKQGIIQHVFNSLTNAEQHVAEAKMVLQNLN
ncbi:MAG: peroxiredoxin Q/BCP [Salibacteraceae bacterium]|jgi:peroxiredoxin Q/BCP